MDGDSSNMSRRSKKKKHKSSSKLSKRQKSPRSRVAETNPTRMSQREDYMPDDDGSINVGSSGFATKKTTTNLR